MVEGCSGEFPLGRHFPHGLFIHHISLCSVCISCLHERLIGSVLHWLLHDISCSSTPGTAYNHRSRVRSSTSCTIGLSSGATVIKHFNGMQQSLVSLRTKWPRGRGQVFVDDPPKLHVAHHEPITLFSCSSSSTLYIRIHVVFHPIFPPTFAGVDRPVGV